MSSLNDTSEFTGTYSETIYSRDDESFSNLEKTNIGTQMTFSPSRFSTTEGDLITGSISDEETPIYDDDYTSGYGSLAYDSKTYNTFESRTFDDSFPQSPRSDELSSTFASFYLESESARKVRSTFFFLRRPLVFFSIAMSGSGVAGAICRVVHMVTAAANVQQRMLGIPNNRSALPEGFSNMPRWMHDARQMLPSVVELTAKKILMIIGIRSISELQNERLNGAIESLARAKQELTQITSGPMVPLFIFLPLFSFGILSVAQHVIARQTLPRDIEDEDLDILNDDIEVGTKEEMLNATKNSDDQNFRQERYPQSDYTFDNDPNLSQHEVEVREDFKNERNNSGELGVYEDSLLPPVVDAKVQGHLRTDSLSDSPSDLNTIPTTHDVSSRFINEDEVGKDEFSDSAASSLRLQELQVRLGSTSYTVQSNLAAAIAGDPSPAEIDVLLIAAVRYGCQKLILPLTVSDSALISAAPSLPIERVESVIDYVMDVEEPNGMTSVGVFLRPVAVNTVELSLFTHPHSAVYVFVPASSSNETMVASLVECSLFTSLSDDEPLPVNACFNDRYLKERQISQ